MAGLRAGLFPNTINEANVKTTRLKNTRENQFDLNVGDQTYIVPAGIKTGDIMVPGISDPIPDDFLKKAADHPVIQHWIKTGALVPATDDDVAEADAAAEKAAAAAAEKSKK